MAQTRGEGLLDICIPTCHRAEVIRECLEDLLPEVQGTGVRVRVSDNASPDGTREVLAALQAQYECLDVITQPVLLEPDRHFEVVLRAGQAAFVWLMGDGTRIQKGFLPKLLEVLAQGHLDAVLVNGAGRVKDVSSQVYTDQNALLRDLGWHITQMSAFVYARELVRQAPFERYHDSNFLQTGILFESIAGRPFRIAWMADPVLGGTRLQKRGSWEQQVFPIFGIRWMNFVLSLPVSYALEAKLACVQAHGVKSGLFTVKGFRKLRRKGLYGPKEWFRYRQWFPWLTTTHPWVLLAVALLPLHFFFRLEQRLKAAFRKPNA